MGILENYTSCEACDCQVYVGDTHVPKSDLRKLRDDMSNSIGPVYNDKTRVWLKRIDELLDGGE